MARGVRKTSREKLEEKAAEIRSSIVQYEDCLKILKAQERECAQEMEHEDLKELSQILKECSMTTEEVKHLVLNCSGADREE